MAADSKATEATAKSRVIDGIRIETIERGSGRPLLFLHPGIGIAPTAPVLDRLAQRARLIAPTHPGFGAAQQPPSFNSIDDLAYFYLDLIDALDLTDPIVVAVSLGGWIAAEMAVGLGHLLSMGQAGFLSHEDTIDSMTLFGKEVLPRLKVRQTAAAEDTGAAFAGSIIK
jgi:hypothetical protein